MRVKIWSEYNYWLLAVLFVFIVGIIIQANMMLNFDASWLIKAANKLLNGGHYYTDFIDANPPFSLYLYIPAVLLAKICHINFALAFKIYTFAIAAGSIYLCHILMRHIFDSTGIRIHYILLVVIAFVFILMPAYSFGEREHFTMMLTLPYLFLLDLRLLNKSINFYLILLIGLAAGIGFAIKPYFLLTLIACELYFMCKKRSLFACVRFETILIGAVILLYLISIFIFTPNYMHKILPLSYLYFVSARASRVAAFLQGTIIFWLIVLGVYFLLHKRLRYKSLAEIFIFASIGYLITYFIQGTNWYYHLLPILTIATLLMVLFLCEKSFDIMAKFKSGIKWFDVVLLVLLQIFIVIAPITDTIKYTAIGMSTVKDFHSSKISQYVKNHAYGQSVYVFDERMIVVNGLVDYAHAISASRFSSQSFLPGLIWLSHMSNLTDTQKSRVIKDKQEIIDVTIEDLQKNRPKLILENLAKHNLCLSKKRFSFIGFFSQDKRFRKLFKHYKYITVLDDFAIYARKNNCLANNVESKIDDKKS
jgi:hypothetical protein